MTKTLTIWSPSLGDVPFSAQQAALVGASFGNGAATGNGTNANNLLQMGDDGNLVTQINAAGVTPGATGADRIIAIMNVPAGGFDLAGRGINIMAGGNAPNTNAKTVKIIVNPTNPVVGQIVSGGTLIAGLVASGAGSQGGWNLAVNVFKYGAAGSNTQLCIHESGQSGSIVGTLSAPSLTTFPENAVMQCVITGNVTTGVGDLVYNFGSIFAMN